MLNAYPLIVVITIVQLNHDENKLHWMMRKPPTYHKSLTNFIT